MRPSFLAAGINGLTMLIVIILVVIYWKSLSDYERIIVMSLLSLQIGIHALLHHMEEIHYNYNPLEGKW